MITGISFYIFSAILLASAVIVITARNPVYAVMFLIMAFFNASALFLIAGAEFLAMILVIVYVGAVAVLFLFVVMMLDIDRVRLSEGLQKYAPIGIAIGLVLLGELALVLMGWKFAPDAMTVRFAPMNPALHNTHQLGQILYTDYVYLFQVAGLVLFVAMIGAIVLTLREKGLGARPSRHQSVARQVARMPADTLEMVEIVAGAPTQAFLKPKIVETVEAGDHDHHDEHTGHGGH